MKEKRRPFEAQGKRAAALQSVRAGRGREQSGGVNSGVERLELGFEDGGQAFGDEEDLGDRNPP